MPSKKLMTLLRAFSRYELNRFEKYIISPYFNDNKDLELLYRLIARKLEAINKKAATDAISEKQYLWQHLYKNKPYNDGQIRRLLSELTQHMLHFLAIEQLQKESAQTQIILLELLKERKLDLHFNFILRQEKKGLHNSMYHFYQHRIEEIQNQYAEELGYKIENLESLGQSDFHLDCYYFSQKLKNYCDSLAYRYILSIQTNIQFPPYLLEWLTGHSEYTSIPSVNVYLLVVKMLQNPHEEYLFFNLKDYLYQNRHFFSTNELASLYIYLKNYCIDTKINIGRVDFYHELFEIFKTLIDINILIKDGMLNSQDYKHIVHIGLQINEFDWTEHFIQTYTPKLPPEEQENALTYNLAKVYFAQQRYEKVIEQLREVEYQNLTYALGGKLMLLKTYYELNEYLALDSLIDSFRVYLRRNKTISKEVRQQYMNVLRFIKKLSNVRPGDQTAIAKIETQIQECKNLADKGWIVQKLEELKGAKGG